MKIRLFLLLFCSILFPNCEQDGFPTSVIITDKTDIGLNLKPSQYCYVQTDSIVRGEMYNTGYIEWFGKIVYNNPDNIIIKSEYIGLSAKIYSDSTKKEIVENYSHAILVTGFKNGESYQFHIISNSIDTDRYSHYYPDSVTIVE